MRNYLSIFDLEPSTLQTKSRNYKFITSLYHKYWDELKVFCDNMHTVRARMLAQGFSADFGDREAEILYLILRELKPDVVVEISPCHGYSTNYILAALTNNNRGKLYSFEIQTSFNNQSIDDVIKHNLSDLVDRSRLELRVGDVRESFIPDCDLLFIDSCHESYFASWYFSNLVHKPKLIFVHDILIFDKYYKTVVPKAAFLGVREQYYALESLMLNDQNCFSVAKFEHYMEEDLKNSLPTRYEGGSERSIIFRGHEQSEAAKRLHATQILIQEIQEQILLGFREEALKRIMDIVKGDYHFFSKLEAVKLLPQMGYRYPMFREMFPSIEIEYHNLSISELVQLFELAITSSNRRYVRKIVKQARKSSIHPLAFKYIAKNYLSMIDAGLLGLRSSFRWARRLPGVTWVVRRFA